MAKKKKEVKVVLEEEKGAKNRLSENDDILYSFATHIEKTKVKEISGKIAILANGVRVFKRYNNNIIREDGKTGYVILPWTEEANDKWESYTLSMSLNQMLETMIGEIRSKELPIDKIRKYHSKISKLIGR